MPLILGFCLSILVFPNASSLGSVNDSGNELLIVDCLLPGQLRKLGRHKTYLTPRRPIKTSAGQCEIRGGEYVAYDRSSYATALKVWLPKAKEGDTEAQIYVGEIYEKGLGLQPDYEVAAAWYKKAAEKGNSTAQINLGHLYEKGLGVPKDPQTALYWYRRASGLGDEIAFIATEELEELKVEVEKGKQEIQLLRKQLIQTQDELDNTRDELERRKKGVRNQQQKLNETRRELERLQQGSPVLIDNAELTQLTKQLKEREAELAIQRKHISILEREAESFRTNQKESESMRKQLELKQKELEVVKQEAENKQLELEKSRKELEKKRKELAVSTVNDEQIKEIEKQKKELEMELEKQKNEMNKIRDNFGQLKAKADKQSEQLAMLEKQAPLVADSGPIIVMIDPKIERTRGIKERIKTRSGIERSIVGRVIASAGLKTFTVNGMEEGVDNNGLFQFKKRIQTKEVPIKLVAIDKKGRTASVEFLLAPLGESLPDPKIQEFGEYYALIIGNNDYTDPNWQDLKSPKFDATMVEKVLKEKYGFNTEVLLNASRRDILQALEKYQQKLSKGDNFLIYYAGHGQLDEELNRGFWIPVDGGDNKSRTNWISTLIIADFLGVIKANHILVVADSCYSGSFTRSSIPQFDAGMSPEALKTMLSKKSRLALTSGDLQPVLDTGGGKNSVFAKAIITVLKNNNKVLPGQNLHNQVYNSVVYKVEQVPQYAPIRFAGHQAGDYFFVPVALKTKS
ncbi:caspase family protein [Desulfobacterota bacterium AH_259_B03_O07]|nr:caspase family protein [Desulfobacterota bacterium AH_259_B03_O07]